MSSVAKLRSLRARIGIYLSAMLLCALLPLLVLVVRHDQAHLEQEVARHAVLLTDMVAKSTRYAMLTNKRDVAARIIEDIGHHQGLERLRVISADGTIIHTNRDAEFGYSVEQADPPCAHCHIGGKPLEHVADEARWRIHADADGRRVVSAMLPIYNEPGCSNAACHEHPPSQKVLGVIDVALSLDEVDTIAGKHWRALGGFGLGFALLVGLGVAWLLQRQMFVPLRDLEAGAARISAGELSRDIPVRRDDELGRVAAAFNQMQLAVRRARDAEEDLIRTLEQKVEVRTKALMAAQAEAAQGQKLASVGMLASGIAHELNSPLTGILTFTSLLRKKLPDGTPDADDLDLVIGETRRCASIIRRLLDFAREKVPVKSHFDLNALVTETLAFIDRPAMLHNIEVQFGAGELPPMWGDADLIKQVLLNLLVNAQQAINGAGEIGVSTIAVKHGGREGVEITVRDSGCGIPPEHLPRIFDPFFTSKEVGKGTGLGLSVSYGIIKAHGGEIGVESEVGVGTCFRVFLPLNAEDPSAMHESKT
jgi:two-component system NtrC family sensor kinase